MAKRARKSAPVPSVASLQPAAYLERNLASFPNALARAARYIIENPDQVVRYSLKELSTFSRSGEASIVRLCHLVGVSGFSDFKIALAQELALRARAEVGRAPSEERDQIAHFAQGLANSILTTLSTLEIAKLEDVIARMRRSARIYLFGSGVSGIVAELFSYRLLRAGFNAHAIRDANLAHEIMNGLGPNATAIAISDSGQTADSVEFLRGARLARCFTVAVTGQERSALTGEADATILLGKLDVPAYGGVVTAVPRAVFLIEVMAILAAKN
jgi:DNA-binding MurR/RpiR family transcriptional regulator